MPNQNDDIDCAKQKLFNHHKDICNIALELMVKKNNDYAAGSDPFANFRRGEVFNLCSVEVGILLRITDKLSRLSTFANNGKLVVDNEGYADAIVDIINYCVIFSAYVKTKQ